ncbi:hypothetical protein OAT84_02585 [Gammaproteobacteria bacterium]|nr:hypothetical protein [Gammaproteobacteria bacterium]
MSLLRHLKPTEGEFKSLNFSVIPVLSDFMKPVNIPVIRTEFIDEIKRIKNDNELDLSSKLANIDHIISYLPIIIDEEIKQITLPIYHNGAFSDQVFQITRIPLGPLFIPESMQVYASLLESNTVSTIVLFPPTLPSKFNGRSLTQFADFFPFSSVGWPLNRKNKALLNKLANKSIKAYGASLGGSLALAHCNHMKDNNTTIEQIRLFNPALPWCKPKINCDDINVFFDSDDPVMMGGGQVPDQATVEIVTPKCEPGTFYFIRKVYAHLRLSMLANHSKTSYNGKDFNKTNRAGLSIFLYWFVRPIIFSIILVKFTAKLCIEALKSAFCKQKTSNKLPLITPCEQPKIRKIKKIAKVTILDQCIAKETAACSTARHTSSI